ncbi:MAG: D-2-hydroxyacid dehydrogenase [Candidatus Latescibacterota bacterium]
MRVLVHYDLTAQQQADLLEVARAAGDHEVVFAHSEAEALCLAPACEALIGHFLPAVCAAAPRLRWIQSFSAGMDNFLFPGIVARDVVVTNMAGLYASQGAEHAWALLLALSRGIPQAVRAQQQRAWRGGPAIELAGGTLLVVGLGGFGQQIARRAAGYDMTVIALDPQRREPPAGVHELLQGSRSDLHGALPRADACMLACPRTPQTYHLIGPAEFGLMQPTAYLVNVTRGGIVDETALVEALAAGRLAGAALDVCEIEPPPPDSPLWEAPNLLLTAHRAGASQHRASAVARFFAAQLGRFLRGEPLLNVVDKQRGY